MVTRSGYSASRGEPDAALTDEPDPTASRFVIGAALFGAFAVAYVWGSPSLAYQTWDSLDYSRACELHGPRSMWGNHPLGYLLECGLFTALQRLGYEGRALPIFAFCNGVTSAAAVAALFALLAAVVRLAPLQSAGWAVAFGGAYGFWHYAGTAEAYGLTVLLIIGAWAAAILSCDRPSRRRSLLAGSAVALATLVHQFAGVILVAGTIGLMFHRRAWRTRATALGTGLAVATLTIAVGYPLLAMLARGSTSPAAILDWLVGHGYSPQWGRSFNIDGITMVPRGVGLMLLGDIGYGDPRVLLTAGVVGCLVLALLSAFGIRPLSDRLKSIAFSCALQCLAGTPLVIWWAPSAMKFWLLMLPAAITWFALAFAGLLQRLRVRRGKTVSPATSALDVVPLLVGAALCLSTGAQMLRERQPKLEFERALHAWSAHSAPDDVLFENGRLQSFLVFWERRPGTINLASLLQAAPPSDRFAKVRQVIEGAAQQGRAVLYTPTLSPRYSDEHLALFGLTRQQLLDFFDQYPREGPLFEFIADERGACPVYRLVVREAGGVELRAP